MKKILSILLSTAMLLTLVPASAFAVDQTLIGNKVTYSQADTNKEVKVLLDLGKFQDLEASTALFQLENAKLASAPGAAKAVVTQGTTTKTDPDIVFTTTAGSALSGGEQFFNLKVNTAVPANNVNSVELLVTLKLDFSGSEGDVNLVIRDNDTNIGDSSAQVATDQIPEAKDMEVRVASPDSKIGPAGGKLSTITILDLGKLSATTSENSLVLSLPRGYQFTPASAVETGTGSPNVTYSTDKDEMIIKNINKNTSYVNITPFVILKASGSAQVGPINGQFELKVNNSNVSATEGKIGQFEEYGISLKAQEKGKKEIPTLTKGQAKTVELELDAIEGTLSNGQIINFEIKGGHMVYGSLAVTQPSGLNLTASAKAADKFAGQDVYRTGEFAVRTNQYGIKTIKLEFDLLADTDKEAVTITAYTQRVDDQTIEVAKIEKALKAKVEPRVVLNDRVTHLPDIVLEENQVNNLQKGDKIYLRLDYTGVDRDKGENLAFDGIKDIKVTGTNSLEISKIEFGNQENILVLTLDSRSYTNPGSLTLSNIQGFITNKAAKGDVSLEVMVDDSVEDTVKYFTVSDSLDKAKTQFTIGSTSYMANGVAKTLVTAPYIKGTGYTMLPVRALGESLGLTADWNNLTKTATFASDAKVAVVKIGESTITVNGMKMPLNAPAEIKDSSTMIELRSLANAFDVELDWDGATKTVTVN